jgi:Ca2+-binding RTX toxin-like protein
MRLRSTKRAGRHRRRLAVLGTLSLLTFCVQLLLAAPAGAVPYTGGFSPTIIGGRADLNGDGVVNGRDDANQFYGSTHIIDGFLDCNNWSGPNDGAAGDGVIDGNDDCTLIGFDGTADGVTIEVIDGEFQMGDGPLPTVFNAADPDNPDVGASDFAWSAIGGRVDSNGNESIGAGDCHFGLIGETPDAGLGDPTDGADILGNTQANTNPCGFANPPAAANNGLVDLNSDGNITGADSCTGCFFGLDVQAGFVQAQACPGFAGDPRNQVVGTSGPDVLVGTAGADIICGLAGNDVLFGAGGNDLLIGGRGNDSLRGGSGADALRGAGGRDSLRGGGGADVLRGGGGADVLRGGGGPDRLFGGGSNDLLLGGRGNDRLDGGRGRSDRCFGGPGRDSMVRCEIGST